MELLRALAVLAEPPGPEHDRLAELLGLPGRADPAAYTDLFVLQLYPYASVYLGAEGMLGGEARDRVAGFWRALELTPPAEPDHLAALLSFHASLVDAHAEDDAAPARRARHAFFWEHIASWIFVYLERVSDLGDAFYAPWAELVRQTMLAEAAVLGPPQRLPLHLREAPPPLDAAERDAEAFLQSLLAPVRSGIILVRADLATAAGAVGLGMRVGERRFVLRHLLRDAPEGTLAWLAAEMRRQAARHRASPEVAERINEFWASRAERSASLLEEIGPALTPSDD